MKRGNSRTWTTLVLFAFCGNPILAEPPDRINVKKYRLLLEAQRIVSLEATRISNEKKADYDSKRASRISLEQDRDRMDASIRKESGVVVQHKEAIPQRKDQIEKLSLPLQRNQVRLQAINQERVVLGNQITEKNKQIGSSTQIVDAASIARGRAESDFFSNEREWKRVAESVLMAEGNRDGMINEIDVKMFKINQILDELESLKVERSILVTELKDLISILDELKMVLKQAMDAKVAEEKRRIPMAKTVSDLQTSISDLEKVLNGQGGLNPQIGDLTKSIDDLSKRIEEANKEIVRLSSLITDGETQVQRLNERDVSLKASNQTLNAKLSTDRSNLTSERGKLATQREARDKQVLRVKDAFDKINAEQVEIDTLNAEIKKFHDTAVSARAMITSLEAVLTASVRAVVSFKQQQEDLRNRKVQLESPLIPNLKIHISQLEGELPKKRQAKGVAEGELSLLKTTLTNLKAGLAGVKAVIGLFQSKAGVEFRLAAQKKVVDDATTAREKALSLFNTATTTLATTEKERENESVRKKEVSDLIENLKKELDEDRLEKKYPDKEERKAQKLRLEANLEAAKNEKKHLIDSIDLKDKQIKALTKTIPGLQKALTTADATLASVVSPYKEIEKQLAEVTLKIANSNPTFPSQSEANNKRAEVEGLISENQTQQDAKTALLTALTGEMMTMEKSLVTENATLASYQAEVLQIPGKLSELDAQITESQSEKSRAESAKVVQEGRRDVADAEEKKKMMMRDPIGDRLIADRETHRGLAQTLASMESEVTRLSNSVGALESSLAQTSKQILDNQRELDSIPLKKSVIEQAMTLNSAQREGQKNTKKGLIDLRSPMIAERESLKINRDNKLVDQTLKKQALVQPFADLGAIDHKIEHLSEFIHKKEGQEKIIVKRIQHKSNLEKLTRLQIRLLIDEGLNQLEDSLEESKHRLGNAIRQLTELRMIEEQWRTLVDTKRQILADRDVDLAGHKGRLLDLQKELAAIQTTQTHLSNEEGILVAENKDLGQKITDLEARNQVSAQAIVDLEKGISVMNVALSDVKGKITAASELEALAKGISEGSALHASIEVEKTNTAQAKLASVTEQFTIEKQAAVSKAITDGTFDGEIEGSESGQGDGGRAGGPKGKGFGLAGGEKDGRARDFASGKSAGSDRAMADANTQGEADGKAEGSKEGYYANGKTKGTLKGKTDGYHSANNKENFDLGAAVGYPKGLRRAKDQIEAEKVFKSARDIAEEELLKKSLKDQTIDNSTPDHVQWQRIPGVLLASNDFIPVAFAANNIQLCAIKIRDVVIPTATYSKSNPQTQGLLHEEFVKAYEAEYKRSYLSSQKTAYAVSYAGSFKSSCESEYNATYNTAFDKTYQDEIDSGDGVGYRTTYGLEYQKVKGVAFASAKALTLAKPEAEASSDPNFKEGYREGLKAGEAIGRAEGEKKALADGEEEGEKKGYSENVDRLRVEAKSAGEDDVKKEYSQNPQVHAVEVSLADNGDGRIDPGEKVSLKVIVKNFGGQPAPAGSVLVEVEDTNGIQFSEMKQSLKALESETVATYTHVLPGTVSAAGGSPISLKVKVVGKSTKVFNIENFVAAQLEVNGFGPSTSSIGSNFSVVSGASGNGQWTKQYVRIKNPGSTATPDGLEMQVTVRNGETNQIITDKGWVAMTSIPANSTGITGFNLWVRDRGTFEKTIIDVKVRNKIGTALYSGGYFWTVSAR